MAAFNDPYSPAIIFDLPPHLRLSSNGNDRRTRVFVAAAWGATEGTKMSMASLNVGIAGLASAEQPGATIDFPSLDATPDGAGDEAQSRPAAVDPLRLATKY